MVKTLWLVKKSNIPYSFIGENDIVVLIEDAVLKIPTKPNWFVCKEDAHARRIKVLEDKLLSYKEIAQLILKVEKVVVW
ncbi:MAG TPA: sulfurtransferase TusB [Aquifex aeolicus]|uniref:Sulfurtransferase TusB n=1 Tax=Aquifex aeolicus TaxID=63363 RepID=A0A9D0YPU6_AQUAO|nr:sulfurtransferase TusB [Aquificales bacterium]HIP86292.1 sulfurtransferase TusB [Aquifex sp.]HIP98521.1 sulfurtransferase TusB [Aquifex aeolicus]HIQ26252.1 sulfurtransferase TusB [Aquifex aeolicus]